eukprot:6216237-Ditylum_brightwellii.AAC.1
MAQKNDRSAGQLWEDESVTMVKGVSKKTKEKLARAGITLVKDIKYLDDSNDAIAEICRETHEKNRENGLTFFFWEAIAASKGCK